MNLLLPNLPHQLSFSKSLSTPQHHFLEIPTKKPSNVSTIIRMGGGPRTFPGGVSKWQWKRMQAKKAKQLLKARLSRERQIYEMRKRAELKAAVSELERPWEVVERAPNLFSVDADEQVKVLADRFQKPGGFDLWSEKDGPQLFETPDQLPSARFFPKGVVHSVKPYRKVDGYGLVKGSALVEEDGVTEGVDGSNGGECSSSLSYGGKIMHFDGGLSNEGNVDEGSEYESDDEECSSSPMSYGRSVDGGIRKDGNGRRFLAEDVGSSTNRDGESSSALNYGKNGVSVDGRRRKNGNRSRSFSKGVDGAGDGGRSVPSSSFGRNGVSFDGRLRDDGGGRMDLSMDVDRSDGSRLRRKEYGKRVVSKDGDGSNELYSEGVGSVRKHRRSNSIAGRRGGKYTSRTSNYASPRGRGANSEVYDMGLQQDGSYGFQQKNEQSDSTSW
ncbi:probable DEAD-box ATP-dependent RNA helicase 48 [Abrus precatorius]|uniref:Probable DEAD-box ATP-dependent RNA helicase 48 n=1 Tax=Abrus precatorius TaxID=3816 RepID=A0A8B8JZD8_ABRPR|nr:probable DEAD-box ATP-dependent RNA helicase 48 [Abrus precatorius]XP_027336826.1 probable DEAD-box ATP-dependent RNA helicase 48 [Abrus precatorius]